MGTALNGKNKEEKDNSTMKTDSLKTLLMDYASDKNLYLIRLKTKRLPTVIINVFLHITTNSGVQTKRMMEISHNFPTI